MSQDFNGIDLKSNHEFDKFMETLESLGELLEGEKLEGEVLYCEECESSPEETQEDSSAVGETEPLFDIVSFDELAKIRKMIYEMRPVVNEALEILHDALLTNGLKYQSITLGDVPMRAIPGILVALEEKGYNVEVGDIEDDCTDIKVFTGA